MEDLYNTEQEVKNLHNLLLKVDYKMAQFLHSHDKRKIVNALFKFFKVSAFNFVTAVLEGSSSPEEAKES